MLSMTFTSFLKAACWSCGKSAVTCLKQVFFASKRLNKLAFILNIHYASHSIIFKQYTYATRACHSWYMQVTLPVFFFKFYFVYSVSQSLVKAFLWNHNPCDDKPCCQFDMVTILQICAKLHTEVITSFLYLPCKVKEWASSRWEWDLTCV